MSTNHDIAENRNDGCWNYGLSASAKTQTSLDGRDTNYAALMVFW